jgi:hypothetical protein
MASEPKCSVARNSHIPNKAHEVLPLSEKLEVLNLKRKDISYK